MIVSTTLHLTPTLCQDDLLDSFLKEITKTQGHDQVLCTLRSAFDSSLDEQGNPLADEQPTAEEWDESARVLTMKLCPIFPSLIIIHLLKGGDGPMPSSSFTIAPVFISGLRANSIHLSISI